MAVFAAVWWLVGVRASGHGGPLAYAVPLLVSGLLIAATRRVGAEEHAPQAERDRRGRLAGIWSAVEGVTILVAVNVLANTGHRDSTAPVVAIIVGLHFVPLARQLPARGFYATAAALVAVGLAGLAVGPPERRLLGVCAGAACVLWLSAVAALVSSRAASRRARDVPA